MNDAVRDRGNVDPVGYHNMQVNIYLIVFAGNFDSFVAVVFSEKIPELFGCVFRFHSGYSEKVARRARDDVLDHFARKRENCELLQNTLYTLFSKNARGNLCHFMNIFLISEEKTASKVNIFFFLSLFFRCFFILISVFSGNPVLLFRLFLPGNGRVFFP